MSKLTLRGGATALALAAVAAPSAQAAATKLFPYPVVDVSSDGRYVLHVNGDVVDRAGTNGLPQATSTSIDLADRAPIALGKDFTNGILYVRTAQAPRGTVASIGPDGTSVPAATGKLVQNGSALIFSTTERPSRIIKRDLAAGTSTVLMTGVTLLDASEDGKVITFMRGVPVAKRPSGSTPISGDPGAWWVSPAVGYQVGLDAPRIVAVQKISERAPGGEPVVGCPASVELQTTTPNDLQISQDGSQGGQYSLVLSSSFKPYGGYPFSLTTIERLTADGRETIATSDGQRTNVSVRVDPVSGAYARILDDKANGFPLVNRAGIVAPDGTATTLSVLPPEGSTDTAGRISTAIPFGGGAGAVYFGTARADGSTWTYAVDGLPTGGTTAWQTLPRTADRLDSSALTAEVEFAQCTPVAGTFDDYVGLDLTTTGNSAGTVGIGATPSGKIPAVSSRASIAWYGVPIWSKSSSQGPAFYRLPGIPAGLPGFKLTVQVKLADGTVLSRSTALRRTR